MSGARQGPLAVDLWNASEFLTWAGLRLTEAAGGRARLVLEVAPHHRGGAGGPAVNGGIIAYLFDAVCAAAVASTWDEGVTSQATIQMAVSYRRLLLVERFATAEAEVVQRGGSTVFVDARVMDEADRTCAVAHSIYHLFRRRGGDADAGTPARAQAAQQAGTRMRAQAARPGGTRTPTQAAQQAGTPTRAQAAKQAGTRQAGRGAGRAKQHGAEPGAGDATRDGGPAQPKAVRRANGRRSGGARGPGAAGGGGRARTASGPGGLSRG